MTDSGVTVKWNDRDGLQAAIHRASAPPNSRILSAVASRMRGMQIEHFKEQKDSSGQSWAPLRPGTIAARRRRRARESAERKAARAGKEQKQTKRTRTGTKQTKSRTGAMGEKILQDRGKLRASIVRYSDSNVAIVGTNTIYAATHQFGRPGGGWRGSDIPSREFIYLNSAETKVLVEFVSNEIVGPLMKRKN